VGVSWDCTPISNKGIPGTANTREGSSISTPATSRMEGKNWCFFYKHRVAEDKPKARGNRGGKKKGREKKRGTEKKGRLSS